MPQGGIGCEIPDRWK